MIETFKWHRVKQNKLKKELGDSYNDLGLVFSDYTGNIMSPTTLANRFSAAVKKAGLAHHSIHQLRHTFASVAISEGMNIKAVSEVLGHAKISMTLDTYGHLLPGDKESVTQEVTAYFGL